MRRFMIIAATCAVLVLVLSPMALGQDDQSGSSFVPCPLGLDEYPEGTTCGEGGSYILPSGLPAQGTLSEQYTAPTEAPVAQATTALPATGGPSLALLVGALLVGAGLVLRRR